MLWAVHSPGAVVLVRALGQNLPGTCTHLGARQSSLSQLTVCCGAANGEFVRALITARGRARHAEEMIARLSSRAAPACHQVQPGEEPLPATDVEASAFPAAQPRRILYLGRRAAMVPHLREVAGAHAAALLHHDAYDAYARKVGRQLPNP